MNQDVLHQNKLTGVGEYNEDQAVEVDKLEKNLK